MSEQDLKHIIQEAMKAAMRSQDKPRLSAIRLILAAIKQKEVDERIVLDNQHILAILDKMRKQRQDAITQFAAAKRTDLVDKETFEIEVIESFLPAPLTENEINQLIDNALQQSGAVSIKEMGKVMGLLKEHIQGRADIGMISQLIRERLK